MGDKEIAKQAAVSTVKTAIGLIPWVGTAFNEILFEARGRIKQDRVNKFSEEFGKALLNAKEADLDLNQLNSDDFGDLLEALLKNVANNRSDKKREAFKNLLINQLKKPNPIDYAELYNDLIDSLHEKQIPLLARLNEIGYSSYLELQAGITAKVNELNAINAQINLPGKYYDLDGEVSDDPELELLQRQEEELKKEIHDLRERQGEQDQIGSAAEYDMEEYELYYFMQDLCSKGLAVDRSGEVAGRGYKFIEISQLGADLIDAIKATNDSKENDPAS